MFRQQAVVRVVSIAYGIALRAGDRHCRAVAAGVVGIALRQCARFALLHQPVQAVVDVARDRAVRRRLCFLAAAGVVGICGLCAPVCIDGLL